MEKSALQEVELEEIALQEVELEEIALQEVERARQEAERARLEATEERVCFHAVEEKANTAAGVEDDNKSVKSGRRSGSFTNGKNALLVSSSNCGMKIRLNRGENSFASASAFMSVSSVERYSPIHIGAVEPCCVGSPFTFMDNTVSAVKKDIVIVERSAFYISALFKDAEHPPLPSITPVVIASSSTGRISPSVDIKRKHKPVKGPSEHEKKRRVITSKLNKLMARF